MHPAAMCFICRKIAHLSIKQSGIIASHSPALRRLSGVSASTCSSLPAPNACEPPQLPRRISRPGLPASASGAPLTSREIRARFLDHFAQQHGHSLIPSSSVVSRAGEGSFFINAGMNQFKSRILGEPGARFADVKRAANSQRCLRVGGKHNDLEAVGKDGSHHTFFEMLGSWSFGDYWKRSACEMAWKFLTETMRLPASQLYVTYFGGCPQLGLPADSETRDIWLSLGVSDQRLLPFGVEHNFWEMGSSGPCGPCTEIHFDHVGGRCARCFVNSGLPDVVELWNLVFMSHNRPRVGAPLAPLGLRTVDTGMGLERLCTIMQGATSSYDTDLFAPLFASLTAESGAPVYTGAISARHPGSYALDTSLRIVADHARALTVAIGDGLTPGARGAEHKLRQLATRACLHAAYRLRLRPGSLARLAPLVAESLVESHPEMAERAARLAPGLLSNEEAELLERLPMERLTPARLALAAESPQRFADFLVEGRGCSVEAAVFFAELHSVAMATSTVEGARELLSAAGGAADYQAAVNNRASLAAGLKAVAERFPVTDTQGRYLFTRSPDGSYDFPPATATLIGLAVLDAGSDSTPRLVDRIVLDPTVEASGSSVYVLFDRTNFYCESGGQMSDTAIVTVSGGQFRVSDAIEVSGRVFHRIDAPAPTGSSSPLTVRLPADGGASAVVAKIDIDGQRRLGLMRHHTATHALAVALEKVLGSNAARQRSSCVKPGELTLGFGGSGATEFSDADLQAVESECRRIIQADVPVVTEWKSISEVDSSTRRLDSQDYGERVRIVRMSQPVSSGELCCGTHVTRTRDLVDFLVLSAASSGRGQREIRAIAGPAAAAAREAGERLLAEAEAAAAAGNAAGISDVRRQLAGVGRLHRAAVERALVSGTAMARGDANAEVAARLIAELLVLLTTEGGVNESLGGMKLQMKRRLALADLAGAASGIGVKRAILRALTSKADQVFKSCDFLAVSLGDRWLVIASAVKARHLEELAAQHFVEPQKIKRTDDGLAVLDVGRVGKAAGREVEALLSGLERI